MRLPSQTYVINAPAVTEHKIYFTVVYSKGDPGSVCWFFVNSKGMKSFQWIVGLMTSYSKRIEEGGDVTNIVDEMKETFQPGGSYYVEEGPLKGKMVNGIVSHLGFILERHVYGLDD